MNSSRLADLKLAGGPGTGQASGRLRTPIYHWRTKNGVSTRSLHKSASGASAPEMVDGVVK